MSRWPYNTTQWKRLRLAKLSASPICEHCEPLQRIVPALIVDHVIAIRNGGIVFPSLDGLQSLCQTCHNRKTASDVRGANHIFKGYDAEGNPIDKTHGWHTGEVGAYQGRETVSEKPGLSNKTYLLSKKDTSEGWSWG